MPANDPVPHAVGAMFIVAEGVIMIPIFFLDAAGSAVSSYFKDARTGDFDTFFKNSLGFEDIDAKNLTFRYLTSAWTYSFAPGLGASCAGQKFAGIAASGLDGPFRDALVGKPISNGGKATWELRLGEYLKLHKNPRAAKSALTPAKRDALRAEAKKLLGIPAAAFVRRYKNDSRFTTIGVRG